MEPSAASKRAYKNKCSFSGCKNNNNTSSLFKFPVKDKHRQAVWIKNSGNPHLKALNDQQLRNHFLCQEHFGEEYLLHRHTKTILTRSAIPYPFKQDDLYSPKVLKVKTPIKVYGRKRSNIDVLKLSSPVSASPSSSHEEPPKYQLKPKKLIFKEKKVTKLVKQNKALKEKVRRLKSKMSKDLFSNQLFKSDVSKLLTSMQTSFGKYRKSWSVKEKNFCLSLYYKSPSAYKFLLNSGVVLAASSTVQKWLAKSNYTPGINKEVFHQLKLKFADSTEKEKSCVLCFDEMSIMKNLEYSKKFDLIEGFEDLGHGKRNNKIAHYTLVFMIRGLYNNWKAPIAYFLSNSNVKADNLLHLIKAILNKLIQSGMLPKAMVCDQMTINQQVHRKLGVTLEKPYFELNTSKIYCLFDTPHLIKNIRNNFIGSDFMFENKILSFQDIITVYEINKNNDSSALTKLTPIHLNPNAFQKMKVSLATQVFSHSVAAAIRTAHSTGELKSKTARDTADFIEYVNNLFDALNSKNKIDKNPYCCALTVNNTLAKNALTNGHNIFRNLHKVSLNNKNDKIIVKTTRPPSFDGFVQTIEAVLQLTAQETNNGIKFVMTNRLNQDVLENLFSLYRAKGGYNRNPTAKMLRLTFRNSLISSLLRIQSATNCEKDADDFLVEVLDHSHNEEQQSDDFSSTSHFLTDSNISSDLVGKCTELIESSVGAAITLRDCSVQYFAGYLAKCCIDKFQCQSCVANLTKDFELTDPRELLILNRNFSWISSIALKSPSDNLFQLVDLSLKIFSYVFENIIHKNNLRELLLNCVTKTIRCENEDLLEISCSNHIKFLLDHLCIVKINHYCKLMKKNHSSQKVHPKIRILKNK